MMMEQLSKSDRNDIYCVTSLILAIILFTTRHFSIETSIGIIIFVIFSFHQFIWRRRNLPPGPMPLPLLGNTLSMNMRHPASTFASWHAQYGPIYTVWLPHPMIVLASHDALKEALMRKGPSFAGRPCGYIWSMFTQNMDNGDGIILCDGERWQQIREFAHKIFRNFGLGRTQMEDNIMHHIKCMTEYIDSGMFGRKEARMDMEEPISLCVANIIQSFVMGKSYTHTDSDFKKFKNLIDSVLADVASKTVQMVNAYPILAYLPIPALKRYKENGFALQRYFLNEIREHKATLSMEGEPKDFMEAYLRQMETDRNNPHFNNLTLALASGDLWTGGMETTVTTMRWAIIYMLYYPSVQQKCHQELDTVFGSEEPCYARRKQLPYIEATIAEIQRIVNVLPWAIPHRTTEEVTIMGFHLPKGCTVLPQYGTVHFDPQYYPNPDKFKPERFLDEEGLYKRRPECNPFGMGKRSCLGENLARYELFLIFTTLLHKYEFSPIEGEPLPSLRRSEGMTNVPEKFECLVTHRNPR